MGWAARLRKGTGNPTQAPQMCRMLKDLPAQGKVSVAKFSDRMYAVNSKGTMYRLPAHVAAAIAQRDA